MEAFNAGFFGNNASCALTMIFALMNLLGPSKQNQEWSLTRKFALFLQSLDEHRNHLQDAKSSRFGKYPEFMVLICYHFKYVLSLNFNFPYNRIFYRLLRDTSSWIYCTEMFYVFLCCSAQLTGSFDTKFILYPRSTLSVAFHYFQVNFNVFKSDV